jgi:hypothetical protein
VALDAGARSLATFVGREQVHLSQAHRFLYTQVQNTRRPPHHLVLAHLRPVQTRGNRGGWPTGIIGPLKHTVA